ncbi:hypothetical protein KP509_19G003200 [Ceratopteris richardii]|uniref:Uncharacterized protein n=1 Tax=Ceratopteris richardii TaxID=49495 RepID=A0A8T2SL08_CERRI|nr:hypothetical protein KP509_19G003200 [Ceratopteris richardii]
MATGKMLLSLFLASCCTMFLSLKVICSLSEQAAADQPDSQIFLATGSCSGSVFYMVRNRTHLQISSREHSWNLDASDAEMLTLAPASSASADITNESSAELVSSDPAGPSVTSFGAAHIENRSDMFFNLRPDDAPTHQTVSVDTELESTVLHQQHD